MSRDWETQFREWAKPPGKLEQDRCANAESAIRNAIKSSDKLRSRSIKVFTQGSYRNNTNVRKDSDVDIGILCDDVFFHEQLPEGINEQMLGFKDGNYLYSQFKNEIEEALISYFGRSAIKRGNKAFDIHETSYHVEADVATFFEHRRYKADKTFIKGVELRADNEYKRIINWPEQHYDNGIYKNRETGTRFKSIVRVLKSLSNEMTQLNIIEAGIPGFLIECLVWNVPNDNFQHYSYTSDVRAALAFIFNKTLTDEKCKEWGEVSELIYLFHPSKKWTRQQAHAFTSKAWDYIGFEN